MARSHVRLSSVVVLLALAACGGELPPAQDAGTNGPDAGTAQDAGAPGDAGVAADAGEVTPDAGTTAPDAGTPDAGEVGPVRYPGGTRHSPLTPSVATRLRTVSSLPAKEDVFAKVGDSITVSSKFLHCFANPGALVLDGRTHLQSTVDHFRAGQAGTTTPFDRVSLAAGVGWRTEQMLAGNPAPIDQELSALTPRAAVFMLGTNDMGFNDLDTYGREMFTLVDRILGRGVVPILSTVPPRGDSTNADARVPRYNAVVRGIAQARQVPYVDLHRELEPLPSRGLISDGVHLTAGSNACDFSAAGLQYAQNARNLLNLEALHRLRGVLQGGTAPDAAPAALQGTGTAADPFIIPSLPFVDSRDTRKDGANRLSTYPGCSSSADESGPELYYQLDVAAPTNLRAYVISLGNSDMDIHLLGVGQTGSDCLVRNHKVITRTGVQGRTYLSIDTYVSGGQALTGEYLLVVLADP
jgi:hypothetical protein